MQTDRRKPAYLSSSDLEKHTRNSTILISTPALKHKEPTASTWPEYCMNTAVVSSALSFHPILRNIPVLSSISYILELEIHENVAEFNYDILLTIYDWLKYSYPMVQRDCKV